MLGAGAVAAGAGDWGDAAVAGGALVVASGCDAGTAAGRVGRRPAERARSEVTPAVVGTPAVELLPGAVA